MVFTTSDYGKISEIPSGFWVYVPGLLPASVFKVVEETTEGYGLDPNNPYKMVMGYRKNSTGSETQHLPSYTLYAGNENENTGQVEAAIDPVMEVTNKRGYGLTVNKVWSDREITKGHDTVYTAVYVDGVMLPGTLREMVFPTKSVYYFWGDLESGKTFADYVVREVTVTEGTPIFDDSTGSCTNEAELIITPVAPGGEINLGCVSKTDESETYKYLVTYAPGSSEGSSRIDTITNTREGGLKIRLFEWGSDVPLANGDFKLYKEISGKYVEQNEYTSDEVGMVTVLYNLEDGAKYKIVQTAAPSGYVGLDSEKEIVFVKNGTNVALYSKDGGTWSESNWANRKDGENGLIAYIDIYNKPFEFVIAKFDKDYNTALEGVHFAVYKQTNATINGYEKSKFKLKGFEDITTDANGFAVVCNKSNPLTVGKVYFIEEIQHLDGYNGLPDDIVFRLDELGKPTLLNTDENGMDSIGGKLTEEGSRYVYTLSVPNVRKNADANLTITKTVEGSFGSRTKEFTFTLTVEGAAADNTYEWTRNGEVQAEPLKSGGTFTLRHDDTVTLSLPVNTAITVTEDAQGYRKEYVLTGDYTLPDEEDKETFTLQGDALLAVTNTYDGVIPTGADLPDVSVVFAGFLALGAVLLARRQKLFAVNDTDSSDEDV